MKDRKKKNNSKMKPSKGLRGNDKEKIFQNPQKSQACKTVRKATFPAILECVSTV